MKVSWQSLVVRGRSSSPMAFLVVPNRAIVHYLQPQRLNSHAVGHSRQMAPLKWDLGVATCRFMPADTLHQLEA